MVVGNEYSNSIYINTHLQRGRERRDRQTDRQRKKE